MCMAKPAIAIIGATGQFGEWYAKYFTEQEYPVIVSGRNLAKARELAAKVRAKAMPIDEACKTADIIIVAVSLSASKTVVENACKLAKKGALVCDFASIKGELKQVYGRALRTRPDLELASIHPMHGPRVSSILNRPIVFINVRKGPHLEELYNFFKNEGARLSELGFDRHDTLMSVIQAATHFGAITSGLTLKKLGITFDDLAGYSTPNNEFELAQIARVTIQNPRLYAEIQSTGKANDNARKTFVEQAQRLAAVGNNPEEFEALIKLASEPVAAAGEKLLKASDNAEYALHYSLYAPPQHSGRTWLEDNKDADFTISVLGPKGTFSERAADEYLEREKLNARKLFVGTIAEVFDIVQRGDCEEGIVPVENLLEGSVSQTLDNLARNKVIIQREIIIPIHHSLVALPKALREDIEAIYSHPQALAQCQNYLRLQFPHAELLPTASTASAIAFVAEKASGKIAAIGAKETALNYELKAFEENIEDEKNNITRFLVIGKKKSALTGNDKTSLVISSSEDRPGLLLDIIKGFARRKINMSRIESRPSRKQLGNYYFYIELSGHQNEQRIKDALRELEKKKIGAISILGSYPACPNPSSIY